MLFQKRSSTAAPEGIIRLFLDEWEKLLEILPKVRSSAPELVDTLLAQLRPARAGHPAVLLQLPDPLGEREIHVLKLIAAGKSNQEIVCELVISLGTAKWHVHNILQKLGARHRAQAIVRARELGI